MNTTPNVEAAGEPVYLVGPSDTKVTVKPAAFIALMIAVLLVASVSPKTSAVRVQLPSLHDVTPGSATRRRGGNKTKDESGS